MKTLVLLVLYLVGLSTYVNADQLEQSRIELEAKKKIYISKALNLTGDQDNDFWGIFGEYERELGQANKDYFDLLRRFSNGYNNNSITEQQAANMLAEFFRIESRKVQIKQSYVSKFQAALPNKKVVRFYQIDNKVDSLIRCDIAKKMPLIEPDVEF